MICQTELIGPTDDGRFLYRCVQCGRELRSRSDCLANVKAMCGGLVAVQAAMLNDQEKAELFPETDDPTLLGNRIAALTTAIGIPPCGGCNKRKTWLNKAHAWLRGRSSGS